MARKSFSMIELVFVIVIMGVLASVAISKFVASREDALVASLRSDISNILKVIPSKFFAENLDIGSINVAGPINAQWIIDTAGLNKDTWVPVQGTVVAVSIKVDKTDCGPFLLLKQNDISFDTDQLSDSHSICKALKNSYPKGTKQIVPITSTGKIQFKLPL